MACDYRDELDGLPNPVPGKSRYVGLNNNNVWRREFVSRICARCRNDVVENAWRSQSGGGWRIMTETIKCKICKTLRYGRSSFPKVRMQHYSSSASEPVSVSSSSAVPETTGHHIESCGSSREGQSPDRNSSKASAKLQFTSKGGSYSTLELTRQRSS